MEEADNVKQGEPKSAEPQSESIDERIEEPGDWRDEMLSRRRALIMEADPETTEERK
jgi:hypothetical protein